jgi:hypothetical protein
MIPDFTISKFNRVFTIRINKENESLIKSISKQIAGSTITNDYKDVCFKASSVKTFAQYRDDLFVTNGVRQLDYETTLRLVFCLSKQIDYCIRQYNKAFYAFSPYNLIVVNGDTFVYCSCEHLIDVNPDNMSIVFTCPFSKKDGFTSPEIIAVDTIPTEIDIRSIYYGFGSLIVYCFLNVNIGKDGDDTRINLNKIKGTKLYWFLLRCFESDLTNRCLLYI